MHKSWEVSDTIGSINALLSKQGYSHRVGYYYKHSIGSIRFELFLRDENDYRCREYGNLTIEQAYTFVDGFYTGLSLGLLDGNL